MRVSRVVSADGAFAGDALGREAGASWGVSVLEEVAGSASGGCASKALDSYAKPPVAAVSAESVAVPSERVAVLEERLAIPLEVPEAGAPEERMAIPPELPDEATASVELPSPPVPAAPSLKAAV